MTGDKPDRDDGQGFLSRWSRRKQQVARGVPVEPAASAPVVSEPETAAPSAAGDKEPAAAETTAAAGAPPPAEAEIDLSKLPRLEDLTADTDYTQFLARGVPEELRTAALRRAWSLDPKIRDFIEVAENQWDFNAPDGVPGFGQLAPGTNLDGLLAQATGQLPAPEPPAQVAAVDAGPSGSPASASDIALQHDGEHGDARDETRRSATVADADPQAEYEPQSAISGVQRSEPDARDEHNARPTRRRHGGALPG